MSFIDSITRNIFVGDLIYQDSLDNQFQDSDLEEYINTLFKLVKHDKDLASIYPSHGNYPLEKPFIITGLNALRPLTTGDAAYELIESWG